ncbi:MAG TPA: GNAT family N-acetyltransferase [Beijerinckiaceae bacterium]|nr:GNAT family N-acetyltransferase [Beijerinckiaceae bacterium]
MTGVEIRDANAGDAPGLVGLIAQIGFSVDDCGVAERLGDLAAVGEPVIVAESSGILVGMLNWHVMPTIHRSRCVGRIVALVVDEAARGQGIGTRLTAEAEQRMRMRGCEKLEVTSNLVLERAHAFYERYGLERSSYRFAKNL